MVSVREKTICSILTTETGWLTDGGDLLHGRISGAIVVAEPSPVLQKGYRSIPRRFASGVRGDSVRGEIMPDED